MDAGIGRFNVQRSSAQLSSGQLFFAMTAWAENWQCRVWIVNVTRSTTNFSALHGPSAVFASEGCGWNGVTSLAGLQAAICFFMTIINLDWVYGHDWHHNITYSFIANCQTAVVHKKTKRSSKIYKSQYIFRYNPILTISVHALAVGASLVMAMSPFDSNVVE